MKLTAAKNAKCPVPKYATFSPWNNDRNQADNLVFKTVSKVTTVTISGDVKVLAQPEAGGKDATLDLKKGDTLQFLVYHAEGFAKYRYDGKEYVINEGDFQGKAEFEKNQRKDDLWLSLPAASGGHGWVLYNDAIKTEGIVVTEIEGFGIANDLPDPDNLSLKGVGFETASIKLTESSKTLLKSLASKLRLVKNVKYEVAGYTDTSGNTEANQKLSQLRAEAVVDYLVKELGVSASKLSAIGYGESNPIADNATPEGRTLNRRVELNKL
jgi:outer membrane protein OmpA-like peptidoglycan-associated protein